MASSNILVLLAALQQTWGMSFADWKTRWPEASEAHNGRGPRAYEAEFTIGSSPSVGDLKAYFRDDQLVWMEASAWCEGPKGCTPEWAKLKAELETKFGKPTRLLDQCGESWNSPSGQVIYYATGVLVLAVAGENVDHFKTDRSAHGFCHILDPIPTDAGF